MTDPVSPLFYEPAAGHGLPHDPFKAIVGPRTIGWIGTVSAAGVPNLAPYSFFAIVCDRPPMVAFSSSGWKDSVANAEATGAFTWSLASRPLAEAMNRTSVVSGPEVDEFALAGLEATPSRLIAPPFVAASPAALECRVAQVVRMATAAGEAVDSWLVVGEVVGVHIDRAFLTPDGHFDTGAAAPVLRAGYAADYAAIGPDALFRMPRPTA